jgi:C-terminal processing protease CtpA/Prc
MFRVHEREAHGSFRIEKWYATAPPDGFHFDAPVFILTSHATFSAAEELAYVLQSLRRATVVGETTGGGANPGDVFPVSPGFDIFVPTGYVEGVTTHKNWEGVGVQPDILVPADQALAKAYELALKGIAPANPRASAALADIDAALRSSVQF